MGAVATLKFMEHACKDVYSTNLVEASPCVILALVENTSNPSITLKIINDHRAVNGVTTLKAPLGHRAYCPEETKVNVRYYCPDCPEDYKKWVLERLRKKYPNWGVEVLGRPTEGVGLVVTGLPECEVEHVGKYVNDLWFRYYI